MFNFSDLTVAGRALKNFSLELQKNRAEQETLLQRRETIQYAPANRADVLAAVSAWAARQQKKYDSEFQKNLNTLALNATIAPDLHEVDRFFFSRPLCHSGSHQVHPTDADTMICGLFGEILGDTLRAKIKALPWPANEGLPLAERAPAMTQIDAQLAKLVAAEKKLVAVAQEAGLSVD